MQGLEHNVNVFCVLLMLEKHLFGVYWLQLLKIL